MLITISTSCLAFASFKLIVNPLDVYFQFRPKLHVHIYFTDALDIVYVTFLLLIFFLK